MTFTDAPALSRAEELFSETGSGDWFLLRTRSRQEKVIAADLSARRVPNFLPLIRCVRFYGGRKAVVEMPLFPGYVFLRGTAENAYSLDRAGRVAQIIVIGNQRKVNWELRNIDFALVSEAPLHRFPYLKVGVRVEVRSGPLRGLQGVIESRGKRDRLILQVDILGTAVSMEMDGELLDVIE
jgi:transcription antitermination factor NusG